MVTTWAWTAIIELLVQDIFAHVWGTVVHGILDLEMYNLDHMRQPTF
jgi:hypothetical protein